MKILHDDRTTSITATDPFSANFPIANVQDDKINSRYIPSAQYNGTTATITANFDGSASNKVQAFFTAGLMADTATYSFQNADGSSVIETGTLTTADVVNSDIAGNKNTLNNYWIGQDNYALSQFIIFENPQSADCRLVLTLQTGTDRKSQTSNGVAIASWQQGSDLRHGRFLDATGAVVNLRDHGRALVGSQIVTNGESFTSTVTTNTTVSVNSVSISALTINASVTLTIASGKVLTIVFQYPQISSYTGSGTAAGSVTISSDLTTQSITSIINPIRMGIFRAGSVLDLPNPQIGVANPMIDYSTRRRLTNGGYQYKQFNIGKSVGLSFILTNAELRSFEDFVRAYRSKPFAGLFLTDMPASQEESTRYSGFYYLQEAPETSFDIGKTASNVSTSFTLIEIF
tara:strand:+ start:2163 stop:3371 length:1209 start_codon:yes stop_codon:yes gene_type:complete